MVAISKLLMVYTNNGVVVVGEGYDNGRWLMVVTRAGPWGVQEALPNRASKNYGPKKNYNTQPHLN